MGKKVGIKLCNKVGDKVGDKLWNKVGNKVGNKLNSEALNFSQIKVLAEIRNNSNITTSQLMVKCNLGKTSFDNIIKILKNKGYIQRIGSKKNGYWEVLK